MSLSKRIAEARKAAGLTQTEVARRLGIRPQSVQAWESGVSAPRARRLTELARVLEVPEAYFFESEVTDAGGQLPSSAAGRMAQRLASKLVSLAEAGRLDRRSLKAMDELLDLLAKRKQR